MDLSSHYFHNQNNNYEYPRDNIKSKKSRKSSPRKNNTHINNNNILQFSLNAINNILINNLNSSVSLGFLNLTNDINIPNILNNNTYINSLHDTIDYKIRGNIYKPDKKIFNNFPNLMPLLINKSCKKINRNEIKIMKLDKDIVCSKNKTPIKKVDKRYYLNLMQNNGINLDKYKHYKNNSENIDNNIDINISDNENINYIKKSKKINNYDKYAIYRTCTTINSKEKNLNKITYKKKISPNKKLTQINKKSLKPLELNNNNKIEFKNKFVYKIIKNNNNINKTTYPKKVIIINKNKDKEKNSVLKNKNINSNIIINNINTPSKHFHSKSNFIQSYKPLLKPQKNNYNNNNIKGIVNINNSNNSNIPKIIYRNTISQVSPKNKLTKINTINNNINNKNLNIPYISPRNNKNIKIISKNKNKVFNDDEGSIFKVIDNTQILTSDEFNNSKNSNKLNQLSGSNTTNTNQDTDYNSIKKFNNYNTNNFLYNNEDLNDIHYFNNNNINTNFSFNNL